MDYNSRSGTLQAHDRDRVRDEVALALRETGTPAHVLASVLAILIRETADSAAIDLVRDDGSLIRVLTRHIDPEKERILSQQREENPLLMTASYGYPRVIKTGKSQFIPGVSERIAGRLFPEANLVVDGLVIRSYICAPLVARGRTLGALTALTTGNGRSFDGDDLLFFEEIAKMVAESLDDRTHGSHHRLR